MTKKSRVTYVFKSAEHTIPKRQHFFVVDLNAFPFANHGDAERDEEQNVLRGRSRALRLGTWPSCQEQHSFAVPGSTLHYTRRGDVALRFLKVRMPSTFSLRYPHPAISARPRQWGTRRGRNARRKGGGTAFRVGSMHSSTPTPTPLYARGRVCVQGRWFYGG